MHPEFGPIAIISALSLLLPLSWHWRAGNVATLSIIGWLFVSNIIYAVDSLVWADNLDIVIPVWCDISESLNALHRLEIWLTIISSNQTDYWR